MSGEWIKGWPTRDGYFLFKWEGVELAGAARVVTGVLHPYAVGEE